MKLTVTGLCLSGFLAAFAFAAQACSTSSSPGGVTPTDGGGTDGGGGLPESGGEAGGDSGGGATCKADESAAVPADRCTTDPNNKALPQCGEWVKVEIPGTLCGDGSQYKFFVNYSNKSNNVALEFEPGGACWDYDSCTGNGGTRGAANPNGIADDHMTNYQYLNLLRRSNDNPVQNYNLIFVSYCTGDLHSGSNTITYTGAPATGDAGAGEGGADAGDAGTNSIVFHHAGHANTMAVVDWVKKTFSAKASIPKLLVTGCSAGGAGGFINYHFIRQGLGSGAQCAYLLDDSGPIFHSAGASAPLHAKVRSAWNVDAVLDGVAPELGLTPNALKADFGLMNTALAKKYPKDRLSLVAYHQDLNYSVYSYQRFYPNQSETDIHTKWWTDMTDLMKTYDAEPNLAYYLPFWRDDNCSHCVSIPPIGNAPVEPTDIQKALNQPWLGSDISQLNIDLKQFTIDLLDDTKKLKSYVQEPQPNASFSPAVSQLCLR